MHKIISVVASELKKRDMRCAVAESCTGGLVGAYLTSVPGASKWFSGGIISYNNDVKQTLLGVDRFNLCTVGEVSDVVVRQMALNACLSLDAQAAVALSGIAGPGGGNAKHPVGTVWIGTAVRGQTEAFLHHLKGNRYAVRQQAAMFALLHLISAVRGSENQ